MVATALVSGGLSLLSGMLGGKGAKKAAQAQAEANPAFQQRDAEGNPVQPEPRGLILRSLDALNEGIIDIVAAPLDLSHAIATPIGEALGVDMSAGSPYSAGIRDAWHGLGLGQRDEGSAPRSDFERYGQAFLRGTGSALIPVGGTLGVGSKLATRTPSLATQASAARTALRESLVDAARSPGTAVALEAGAGAGSYLGEEVANDLAPGNPYAALAGQMIGGLGGGFAGGGAARRLGARSSGDTVVLLAFLTHLRRRRCWTMARRWSSAGGAISPPPTLVARLPQRPRP